AIEIGGEPRRGVIRDMGEVDGGDVRNARRGGGLPGASSASAGCQHQYQGAYDQRSDIPQAHRHPFCPPRVIALFGRRGDGFLSGDA
ncbi:hypothetical protein NLU14_21780, partial [Marinobacter sp. 71-i]